MGYTHFRSISSIMRLESPLSVVIGSWNAPASGLLMFGCFDKKNLATISLNNFLLCDQFVTVLRGNGFDYYDYFWPDNNEL